VPGEQEQQHLITDLAVGEALAGVGVAGRQQPCDQVVAVW
jgi:hypothetical protein